MPPLRSARRRYGGEDLALRRSVAQQNYTERSHGDVDELDTTICVGERDHSMSEDHIRDRVNEYRCSTDFDVDRTYRKRKRDHKLYMHRDDPEIQEGQKTTPLTVQCFYTSIAFDLEDDGHCLVVTNVLLDSGASAHFIHRKLVKQLELDIYECNPITFEIANGDHITVSEYCRVDIWLGGVRQWINAVVDDSDSKTLFILGEPTWNDFLLSKSTMYVGSERFRSVTVAWDVEDCETIRFVVQEDSGGRSKMLKVEHDHDLAERARKGMTMEEFIARENGDAVRPRVTRALQRAKIQF